METHQVCDTLEVYLQHEDGGEQDFKYRLSEEEIALMLPKMDDYCRAHWGQSLEECCANYHAEQSQIGETEDAVMEMHMIKCSGIWDETPPIIISVPHTLQYFILISSNQKIYVSSASKAYRKEDTLNMEGILWIWYRFW